jgi:hypothetical protein
MSLEAGCYIQRRYLDHPVVGLRERWVTVAEAAGPMTEDQALDLKGAWEKNEDAGYEYRVIEVRVVEREETKQVTLMPTGSKREPRGVWRHADDGSKCASYPDSFNWTYRPGLRHECSNHGRNLKCLPYAEVDA